MGENLNARRGRTRGRALLAALWALLALPPLWEPCLAWLPKCSNTAPADLPSIQPSVASLYYRTGAALPVQVHPNAQWLVKRK